MARYDWDAIRAAYISGKYTVKQLHEKFGASESAIGHKIKDDGWRVLAQRSNKIAAEKAAKTAACKKADRATKIMETADAIIDAVRSALSDGMISPDSAYTMMRTVKLYAELLGIPIGCNADFNEAQLDKLHAETDLKRAEISSVQEDSSKTVSVELEVPAEWAK